MRPQPTRSSRSPALAPDAAVVVTGASSGIGRATALQLAASGRRVVLLSRSEQTLRAVQQECELRGSVAVVAVADVSDAGAVGRAFADAEAAFGRVEAVVHAAGALAYGRFEDVPADVFDHALATTLGGTANVARSALQHFHAHGHRGRLVVVGSLLGKIATPYMSSYVTAKWGVHGLVRSLQIEARQTPDIDISLVSPGSVDTPVFRQAGTYAGVGGHPPPPVTTPERVADAILATLEQPVRDRNVGIGNAVTILGFRALPAVFDVLVTPLMRLGGLSREPVGPTPGNVLEPRPEGERVRGGWRR